MAILFDCVMTFFGSTANDASLNAYITDVTTTENRGRVMGVVEILTWVAILIVYGGAGLIIQMLGILFVFLHNRWNGSGIGPARQFFSHMKSR